MTGDLFGEDLYFGSGDASISIYSGTSIVSTNLIFSDSVSAINGIEEAIVSYSGILAAGDYRIIASADPYFQSAYSSYSLNASFVSNVPVPSAIWLFASGIIGLISISRRYKVK